MGSQLSVASPKEVEKFRHLLNEVRTAKSVIALQELAEICNNEKFKEALCYHEEECLLLTFKEVLQQSQPEDSVCGWICLALCRLVSDSSVNRLHICSKELALLPVLMNILKTAKERVLIENIRNVMSTSSLNESTHEYLLSAEVGWLQYLAKTMYECPNDLMSYWRLNNFISRMRSDHLSHLIALNIPAFVLQKLASFGSDPSVWSKTDKDGLIFRIFVFIANFSSIAVGRVYCKEALYSNPVCYSLFLHLLDSPGVTGLLSTVILANVYGRDENNQTTKSLLHEHREILPRLIELLDVTQNYDVSRPVVIDLMNKGFVYGPIKLHVLISSIRNLSVSDENKNIMIKYPKLIELACQEIQSFLDNAREFGGKPLGQSFPNFTGGGGKDFLALENAMELLLQLSFISDDEKILNFSFSTPHFAVKELMQNIINVATERNLPYEVKQSALQFLARLQPKKRIIPVETISSVGSSSNKGSPTRTIPKHVMLSYSWSVNKHLVVAVAQKFREMGYDVWRDEEGSSIMRPMSGDIVETMGEAVDKSYAVVVFVSPEYKESTNCRQEAGYARARAAVGGVKLFYVMMKEDYHTQSSSRQVDGWLGFMIGSELWYPLWNESFIDSTVSSLAALMGDNAKRAADSGSVGITRIDSVSGSLPTTPKKDNGGSGVAVPAAIPADADLATAFSILRQAKKSVCPGSWSAFIKELSLEEPDDLKNFETRKLLALSEFLKPVPCTEFLKTLNL
jgi:hypothetical protein